MKLISKSTFTGIFILTFVLLGFRNNVLLAQREVGFWDVDTTFNAKRCTYAISGVALGAGAMYTYLGAVWYEGIPRGRFKWFNDFHEWKQMDKMGHALGAYQESRAMISLLKWSGVKRNKVILWGGLTGLLLQSPIEIFDGFSPKWGASWGDLIFNASGSALAIGNELLWDEQRIQLKFFFFPSEYPNKYPAKLGYTFGEKLFKDYNGQSYWLSFRVHSFLPEGRFKELYPKWLNLSVGYGAKGLIGGYDQEPVSVINEREYRRWLVSLDIDLANIKTKSAFLRTLLGAANVIRLPLPALEFNRNGVGVAFW